jgi:hypothetical protein
MEQITIYEIESIDSRIKVGYIAERQTENDDFFVQIKYKFQYDEDDILSDGGLIHDGRQDFQSMSKENLLWKIKCFVDGKQDGWSIVNL